MALADIRDELDQIAQALGNEGHALAGQVRELVDRLGAELASDESPSASDQVEDATADTPESEEGGASSS